MNELLKHGKVLAQANSAAATAIGIAIRPVAGNTIWFRTGDGKLAEALVDLINGVQEPIPMVLHCPSCHEQHIDEATEEWNNPPHRSHACQKPGCGTIWRPCDIPTAGVRTISTAGKSDNWKPRHV